MQEHCVNWFRLAHPRLKKNLFAIPNGGFRRPSTGAILKREGALAGVADLFIAYPSQTKHGLFIEMKVPGNRMQESQKEFAEAVKKAGYVYYLCYSIDDFMEAITTYLSNADLQ